jgi:O-acetyl-ADP-ribose deacetylase (regulator of RNase III)
MAFKIVRNDITKMNTEAIVNIANDYMTVGTGCDYAIYTAAEYKELLNYRKEKIGAVPEDDAFITPGFALQAKYIIHAVIPFYKGGDDGQEKKTHACYRKSLELAKESNIKSISFPLISTREFGYSKEEGIRIAIDEIKAFLLHNEMDIYLVVFDEKATMLGEKRYSNLEAYINHNYVRKNNNGRYGNTHFEAGIEMMTVVQESLIMPVSETAFSRTVENLGELKSVVYFEEQHENKLEERMRHMADTFSQYLMYLIQDKKMDNAEVWKRAIVDKKVFSKIKNNPDYHPQKLTALCLCIGAKLNLDESKDLLARAGYALSPCDKTDIIFSYFIENKIYDMIELDIQLEEHGLPCIIS